MDWSKEDAAATEAEVRARHQENRRAWNEGAAWYTAANEARVADLRAGKSNLHPVERRNLARMGPLSDWCQRAVHLQCASGYDTLSLLLEGAHEVVGVDISDVHIENARWTSAQLGLPARWLCCDVLETPHDLNGTTDLVYTGRGAIYWLHDLKGWVQVVARLLRPGGVLSLLEDHPVTWLFSQHTPTLTPPATPTSPTPSGTRAGRTRTSARWINPPSSRLPSTNGSGRFRTYSGRLPRRG